MKLVLWLYALGLTSVLAAGDLDYAPPPFTHNGKRIVPVDFQKVDLTLEFDIQARKGRGVSRIEFTTKEAGYPMLDLVATVTAIRLDGQSLGASALPEVAPDNSTRLRYLQSPVIAGSTHTLEINYDFPAKEVTFSSTGVKVGFFMSDYEGNDRSFLETYAPSNLEFDRFPMTLQISLAGATSEHLIFANGEVTELGDHQWQIRFPSYFTTSSFYFHLTEKPMRVVTAEYIGIASVVPITVYSEKQSLADQGLAKTKAILKELENDYGPFAHERLVIYITREGGGMEHCGATMTSLRALGHELTHSWFARGFMPANGNAGWIDEAIASWRDDGYPTLRGLPAVHPVNMAGHSPYRRTTAKVAYDKGAALLGHFDHLLRHEHGLKAVLRQWYTEKKYQVATTPEWQTFLERVTGEDLTSLFTRFVYGHRLPVVGTLVGQEWWEHRLSHHPRPYTPEERARLR